jgi:hypothetical protein
MQLLKCKISECIQRLCKIYFRFSGTVIPFCQGLGFLAAFYKSAGLLLLCCCCIAVVLLFSPCGQQQRSNKAAIQQESGSSSISISSLIRRQIHRNFSKKYFTEPLYAL